MGAALFIVVERELGGCGPADMDGKSLAGNLEALDEIARQLNVPLLSEFASHARDDLMELVSGVADFREQIQNLPPELAAALGDELATLDDLSAQLDELDPAAIPENVEWFSAAEALPTVRALLQHVRARPDDYACADLVITDLQEVERILTIADREKVRFHLSFDV